MTLIDYLDSKLGFNKYTLKHGMGYHTLPSYV